MKWISVKDNLPSDSATYLVRTTTEITEIAGYRVVDYMMDDDGVRRFYLQHTDIELFVTHWMPLPKPPNSDLTN